MLDVVKAAGPTEPAIRSLHSLKGMASTLGFAAISTAAARAEARLKAGADLELEEVLVAVERTRTATAAQAGAGEALSRSAALL